MSEEEIIEWLKALLECKEEYIKYHSWVGTNTFKAIQGLLDLYNKQKEEIKALELIHETYKEEMKSIEDRFISKDKIRERIKNAEILKHNYLGNTEISAIVYKDIIKIIDAQINVLKELLEEE